MQYETFEENELSNTGQNFATSDNASYRRHCVVARVWVGAAPWSGAIVNCLPGFSSDRYGAVIQYTEAIHSRGRAYRSYRIKHLASSCSGAHW